MTEVTKKPLPKISQPTFSCTVPSTGAVCKYHPFTGKEEKALLIAQKSDDAETIFNAVRQVLINCLVDTDVDSLATFDIEYILLQIRGVSISNVMDFILTDAETGEKVKIKIDVADVNVKFSNEQGVWVKIDDQMTLKMKYPSWNSLITNQENVATSYLISCLDEVHYGDVIYPASEYDPDQLMELFEQMTSAQLDKVNTFFSEMPVLSHTVTYKLKDGTEKQHTFTGLYSFFF